MVKNGMEGTEGFPIGVQVIGKPWQEEMVIGAMKEIEKLRDEKQILWLYKVYMIDK